VTYAPSPPGSPGKAAAATSVGVNTFIVDLRCLHRHRTGGGQLLPLVVNTLAGYQLATVLVERVSELFDIGRDLGLQRCGQHLPGAVADNVIQQPTNTTAFGVGLSV